MEVGEEPLMASWVRTAGDLFATELQELEVLSADARRQDEQAAGDMLARATAAVDAAVALRSNHHHNHNPNPHSSSSLLASAHRPGSSDTNRTGSGGKRKQQQNQQQHQQQQRLRAAAQAQVGEQLAAQRAEHAAMVERRLQELRRLRASEPWRVLATEHAVLAAETLRSMEPVRARERRELDYFLAKPLEAFTMDEVVGTSTRYPLANSNSHHSGGSNNSGPQRPSSARPSTTATTASPIREKRREASYVIDAGAFAEEHNAFLAREYNYKPVLNSNIAFGSGGNNTATTAKASITALPSETTTAATAAAADTDPGDGAAAAAAGSSGGLIATRAAAQRGAKAAMTDAVLLRKLDTHTPGLGTVPPDFFFDTAAAAAEARLDGGHERALLASSLPPIRGVGAASPAEHKARAASATRLPSAVLVAAGAGTKRAASKKKPSKTIPAAAAAAAAVGTGGDLLLSGIECSLKDRRVALRTTAGSAVTATIRLTNRNTNPTRLRLRPSTHSWLQYRCLVFAPVAGGAASRRRGVHPDGPLLAGGGYSIEATPLSCGGYLEVEVTFAPPDLSQPRLDTVVEVGVTREVNARDAEGAQWHFFAMAVACETIVPTFELSCCEEEEGEAVEESGDTHQKHHRHGHGESSGTVLSSSSSGNAFPPTFVYAETTRRYLLRNSGSACLVNLLSTAPVAFRVSPPPGAATLLPRGASMAVTVTFAPSGEGDCEAALTLAVRDAATASNTDGDDNSRNGDEDDTMPNNSSSKKKRRGDGGHVIAEHSFPLLGTGVVPRVAITRVGDTALPDTSTGSFAGSGNGSNNTTTIAATALAKYILANTTPEVTTTLPVVVVNNSAVALPFYWDLEAIAGYYGEPNSHSGSGGGTLEEDGGAAVGLPSLTIEPAIGVLPGDGVETVFQLRVTPRTVAPVLSSLNLFIVGLPDPSPSSSSSTAGGGGGGGGGAAVEEIVKEDGESYPAHGAVAYANNTNSTTTTTTTTAAVLPALAALFSKSKLLPSAYAAMEHFTVPGVTNPSKTATAVHDALADPFSAFYPLMQQPQTASGSGSNRGATFLSALLLFAQPAAPRVTLMPPVLEEAVECLVGAPYARRVVLSNPSPCPVHFLWDPSPEERSGKIAPGSAAWMALARRPLKRCGRQGGGPTRGAAAANKAGSIPSLLSLSPSDSDAGRVGLGGPPTLAALSAEDGDEAAAAAVEVTCEPRAGAIPAGGSVTLKLQFTVGRPGPHTGAIPLYVPELDRGLQLLPPPPSASNNHSNPTRAHAAAAAAASSRVQPRPSLLIYRVQVVGVGPALHVSSELLDFGLIELGCESEASLTVTNGNPVPVSFDLVDPLECEPPRFVFILPSFRLSSGDSVEVTVYRKATSMEDAQAFFELRVRGGGTTAIETRATIQRPTMMLDSATVSFGRVPEGVWQERSFYLTNLGAFDMPFTVELAAARAGGKAAAAAKANSTAIAALAVMANPYVELQLPHGQQMLRAGQRHHAVTLRARFTAAPDSTTATATNASDDDAASSGAVTAVARRHSPYQVLLGLRGRRPRRTGTGAVGSGQVLLLELSCDEVQRLALAVDLLLNKSSTPCTATTDAAAAAAVVSSVVVKAGATSSEASAVAAAAAAAAVLSAPSLMDLLAAHSDSATAAATATAITPTTLVPCNSGDDNSTAVPPRLHSQLPDDSPVCVQELTVRVGNLSGCVSACALVAHCYAPLPTVTALRVAAAAEPAVIPTGGLPGGAWGGRSARSLASSLSLSRGGGGVNIVMGGSASGRGDGDDGDDNHHHPHPHNRTPAAAAGGAHGRSRAADSARSAAAASVRSIAAAEAAHHRAVAARAASHRPRFWTTDRDGTEASQRAATAALASSQRLLLDGRGCVTVARNTAAAATATAAMATFASTITSPRAAQRQAAVGPHEAVALSVTMTANLPGRYEERLRVACLGIAGAIVLPLVWEVRGRPVLLDGTTSGLTTTTTTTTTSVVNGSGGGGTGDAAATATTTATTPATTTTTDVLVMPPTVACLGSSRRTLKLVNRAPRDVTVSVEMFVSGSTFAVTACDDDVPAGEVVLALGPIPEHLMEADRRRFGAATATPSFFFMPAMSTKEVHLEYVPDLRVVRSQLNSLRRAAGGRRRSNKEANSGNANNEKDDDDDDDDDDGDDDDNDDDDEDDDGGSGDEDDRAKGAMSQEVDWEGSLIIQSELARSPFNDAFLMDDFYQLNRARYPYTRTLAIVHSNNGNNSRKDSSSHGSDGDDGDDRDGDGDDEEEEGSGGAVSGGRVAAMLRVVRPIISRPGAVVRNSRLLKPILADTVLVGYAHRRAATSRPNSSSLLHRSSGGGGANGVLASFLQLASNKDGGAVTATDTSAIGNSSSSSDDDDDDDDDGDSNAVDDARDDGRANKSSSSLHDNPVLQAAAESGGLRPLSVLLAEDEERAQLLSFLDARHEELRLQSGRYYSPIELLLRARCGVPLLAVQPSGRLVVFPDYATASSSHKSGDEEAGERSCGRTIRLTNNNSAALHFSLGIDSIGGIGGTAAFRIATVELVPQLVEATTLSDGEGDGGGGGSYNANAGSADERIINATNTTTATMASRTATAYATVRAPAISSQEGVAEKVTAVYCLSGADSLDVTVLFHPGRDLLSSSSSSATATAATAAHSSLARGKGAPPPAVLSKLRIQFYSTTGGTTMTTATAAGTSATGASPGRDLTAGVSQSVRLRVPLARVRVSCAPALLWFKPGRLVKDGRPEGAYPQRLTLFNKGKAPVRYSIVPRRALLGGGPTTTTPTTAFNIDNNATCPPGAAAAGKVSSTATTPGHGGDAPLYSPMSSGLLGHSASSYGDVALFSLRSQAAASPATAATFKVKEVLRMPDVPVVAPPPPPPLLPPPSTAVYRPALDGGTGDIGVEHDHAAPVRSGGSSNRSGSNSDAAGINNNAGHYPFATVTGTATVLGTTMAATAVAAAAPAAATIAAGGHFTITPMEGVIPAATLGGEPGRVVVEACFTEFSNVRYEDEYVVLADGEPTATSFVLRGDSRETEL